jgi:hypothetical protein
VTVRSYENIMETWWHNYFGGGCCHEFPPRKEIMAADSHENFVMSDSCGDFRES